MDDFTFELMPYDNQAQRGVRGAVGPYGDVQAFYVKPVRPTGQLASCRAQLVREHLPETYFTGIGMGGRPSLTKGEVQVGDTTVGVIYNWRAVRRAARAMHLRYGDRNYTYAAKGSHAAVELSRHGAEVAFRDGRHLRGVGFPRVGSTKGAVDEVDLAIALVLEAVDADSLTLGGALAAAPFRLLSTGDGGGE